MRRIAESIAVMLKGRMVAQGPSERDLRRRPIDPYTELLLSSVPEMDTGWLDRVLAERAARKARGEVVLESADQ